MLLLGLVSEHQRVRALEMQQENFGTLASTGKQGSIVSDQGKQ